MLLVDDDRAVRALLATSLEYLGCRILTARNGEEALQALHAKPFVDVVVTEVALPVMGGLELLRTVRQIDGFKTLPVILCSVFIDEATMKKASAYGCTRYLVKPIDSEILIEEITAVLAHRASLVKP